MRIYVACLASYNNGVLHGRWIDASADVDEMQEEVSAMLRESRFPNVMVKCPNCEGRLELCTVCDGGAREVPSAEEFAIHDSEGLPSIFGEYTSLEQIAAFAELADDFDHIDGDDLARIVEEFGKIDDAREALDDRLAGIYGTFRDYADEVADEAIHEVDKDSDSILARYFDYESFARDLRMDMQTVEVSTGIAIFHA